MENHSATARILLGTTLMLALAGDILLRVEPWGINFSLFALLLFAGAFFLSHRLRDPLPPEAWPLAILGILLATCLSWRDSPGLAGINFLATCASLFLVTARKMPGDMMRMTFLDHIRNSLMEVFHLAVGFGFLLLSDLRGGHEKDPEQPSRFGRIWLGIVLAIPALLLFGSLLTSADAKFEYLITEVLRIDFWTLVGHAALIAFLSWTVGGWLRGRFIPTDMGPSPSIFPRKISLGVMEIAIVLGSLDVLFVTFVAVQGSYFFGGHATVLGTPSLTYAEYARRGFFELIAVAALSIPLLVAADWLLDTPNRRDRRIFRALAITMVSLLGVMLASAMHRLSLYTEAYGLTTQRILAAAILIWIAITLLLFCATVLRNRRNLLPYAMLISGYIVLAGLNIVNPDALVARVNTARMVNDGKFDPNYTFRLSADAVPVLLDAIPAMAPEHRSALSERLLRQYTPADSASDIRTWNAARSKAASLVHGRELELRGYVIPHDTTATQAH
jgi:hypothetical protein